MLQSILHHLPIAWYILVTQAANFSSNNNYCVTIQTDTSLLEVQITSQNLDTAGSIQAAWVRHNPQPKL